MKLAINPLQPALPQEWRKGFLAATNVSFCKKKYKKIEVLNDHILPVFYGKESKKRNGSTLLMMLVLQQLK